MFTGIIENLACIKAIDKKDSNITFTLECSFANELKVDQSVSHNGVCLTVTSIDAASHSYCVTAIEETLKRSNLGILQLNDLVNVERCLKLNSLLDGHLVQGHVDTVGRCTKISDHQGSWSFHISYAEKLQSGYVTVEKGSVTLNGVSLTVVDSFDDSFSVAIIPYTYEHTNFKNVKVGDLINIEFDIIGKYVAKLLAKTR